MADKTYSVQQILEDLNRGLPRPEWVQIPNVYSLSEGKIENDSFTSTKVALVLKVMINTRTGEIKTYLSKLLRDVPETESLP